MSKPVIIAEHVVRRFGKTIAVNDVSLNVQAGSIFGLLGTNGAGKTTLIRMLAGHLYTCDGSVRVLGEDPRTHNTAMRQRIAYVSDRMQLPGWMCLQDVIKTNSRFFPKWNSELAAQLVQEFQVQPAQRISTLSLGQKRRALLLQAICQGAEVLILDEPFSGLDAIFRRQCLDMLLNAATEHGLTIVVSSHVLTDVERIVDTIALLDQGRIVTTGNLEDLKNRMRRIRVAGEINNDARKLVADHMKVMRMRRAGPGTDLVVDGFNEQQHQALASTLGDDVRVEHLNLEDIFVELGDQRGATQ